MLKKLFAIGTGLAMAATAMAAPMLINGAGATFPYPIYSKWFDVYSTINPDARFNYQSIGSGGGIKQISSGTVDFGATDGPMTDQQLADAPGRIIHIPTVMGAVVLSYNIPGVEKGLKLKADVIADIYLGKITRWSDPRIASENSGVSIPDLPIVVARRSDGSGTTYIFVDYLSKVSNEWKLKVGKGTSVNWPVGIGGKGNEGVAGLVKQTPGAIGYVELSYAVKNNLPYASVQNKLGNAVEPTLESTSKAAVGVNIPSDFRVSLTDGENPEAYPIAGFTWILVYKNQEDAVRGKAVVDFLRWAITDGQQYATDLLYAPIPQDVAAMVQKKLDEIKIG